MKQAIIIAAVFGAVLSRADEPKGVTRAAPFSRNAMDFVRDEIHVGINIGNTFDVPSGLDCELQVIPGDWGRNLPLDVDISPISIISAAK